MIFGERNDVGQEVVPFELHQGGRIKKFLEDKVVDVMGWTDEGTFALTKIAVILWHYLYYTSPDDVYIPSLTHKIHAEVEHEVNDGEGQGDITAETTETSPGSSGVHLNSGDLIADIEYALDVQRRNRILAQVNLELLCRKEANERSVRAGQESCFHTQQCGEDATFHENECWNSVWRMKIQTLLLFITGVMTAWMQKIWMMVKVLHVRKV